MTDLKPCPICGGKPHITECGMLDRYCCIVAHVESEHTVRLSAEAETKEQARALAVERWNTRHYPPEVEKAVERMKPKKVGLQKSGLFSFPSCPNCEEQVGENYCEFCGQALDWHLQK